MTTPPPRFILTVDAGDLEELAWRLNAEGERYATMTEIAGMIQKRERENAEAGK